MVYCGPISRGCERCRRRKIRCGQQRPSCRQCDRAKQPCTGYRDAVDFMFRHETDRVAEKLQSRSAWRRDAGTSPSADKSDGSEADATNATEEIVIGSTPPTSLVPRSFNPAIENRAACFFFSNYVIPDYPFSAAYIPWLTRAYNSRHSDAIIPIVIEAVGLAGLSNVFNAPDLLVTAYKEYGRALTMVNTALHNPQKATEDTTLMAIWFLGIFETINLQRWDNLRSWYSHIEGAAALIDLRGKRQFSDEVGHLLFAQFRAQIISACLQKNTHIPETLLKWLSFVRSDTSPDIQKSHLMVPTNAGIRLADLRAAVAKDTYKDEANIISVALAIDADLSTWEAELSVDWAFKTMHPDKASDDCFEGVYHVYRNACAAEMWNNYRALRILTHEIILQYLEKQHSNDPATALTVQYSHSKAIIRHMCLQIAASVPSLLGTIPKDLASLEPQLHPATSGLALIWPLFIVCDSPHVNDDLRRWALGRLQKINQTMGIRQAGLMADTLLSDLGPTIPFDGFRVSSGEQGDLGHASLLGWPVVERFEHSSGSTPREIYEIDFLSLECDA